MIKTLLSVVLIVVTGAYFLGQCSAREPVTRGDVQNRQAADEARRCANQYLSPEMSPEDRADIWSMCIGVAAEQRGRKPEDIRALLAR